MDDDVDINHHQLVSFPFSPWVYWSKPEWKQIMYLFKGNPDRIMWRIQQSQLTSSTQVPTSQSVTISQQKRGWRKRRDKQDDDRCDRSRGRNRRSGSDRNYPMMNYIVLVEIPKMNKFSHVFRNLFFEMCSVGEYISVFWFYMLYFVFIFVQLALWHIVQFALWLIVVILHLYIFMWFNPVDHQSKVVFLRNQTCV